MSLWSSALPVSDWLAALRLEQYSAVFQDSGLVAVGDCVHLSNEQLEQMGVSLPGHRKRILGNLPSGRDRGGGGGGEAEEEEQGTMPIPKSRTKFCHTPAHTPAHTPSHTPTQTLQAPSEAPPIPPRLTYRRPPQCFSMATVTTATALEKPTPSPRPRLPKSPKKDAPTPNQHQPSAAPPSPPLSLSPFPPPSLPPSLSPLSPSLPPSLSPLCPLSLSLPPSPLSPSLSPSLPPSLSNSLPPSLSPALSSSSPSLPCPAPASDLHLYEQCSLGQLPPLPPKSYPVGAALAGSLAPPVPRRPPAPPLRPPRTPPGNSSAPVHDPTEPPSGPGIPPRNRLPTTAPKRRVPQPPANSRSLSTDSSDDYEEPDLTNSQEPLDMADKDGFLTVPQPKIRYSCLYSDDELLDDDDDPSTPTRRRSWQDYGLSTLPSSGSVYLPPSGRLATTPPVDDPASSLSTVIKMGWLDKNPPQGARIFQKRWVKLDSEYLRYFDNDKEVYSKRIIPTCCITEVMCVGDQKFEVVTHNRTFLFRADNDLERTEWVRVLQEVMSPQQGYELTFNPTLTPDMQGYLELRGLRSKLYTVVSADKVFLYKNQEDYKLGFGITSIEMNVGNIKDTDRRAFDLTTPYRIFSFVADSEQLKERWVCVMRESIAAALSHSEVAERIWAEPSNALCADCSAPHPEWASINLCVCVCKRCAGEHRSLGPSISKVRSLKMDRKVWTEELIQVFLLLGNERANQFWAANVPPSEALSACSSSEERRRFITAKYRQGKYRRYHPLYGNQQELDNVSTHTHTHTHTHQGLKFSVVGRISVNLILEMSYLRSMQCPPALGDDVSKISKYQQLFSSLPRVNKATLRALVNHLYCVQCFADKNQMNLHNLAIVFGPTLFQTDGKDYNAGRVIEDLIQHYISIFSVDELQLKKQLDEMTLIIDVISDKLKPAPPGGHFICTVYLEEKKESAEQLVKIPATMSASELVCEILDRRKISVRDKDYWCCFQINEKEETERPLHFQERVLPIVHSLGTESHLLVKKHYSMEAMLVFLASKVDVAKHGMMRFREERSLLGLTTGSFNERYFILTPTSLRLYKEVRSNRADREWPVKCLKVYLGIKKKLRPPTCWGLTVIYESDKPDKQERQQWYLCCDTQTELREWFATFLSIQHEGSVWPAEGCKMRSSRSVVSEARLGNVSLIPLRGNESDIRNSVAAFTADALALFKNT
ncbi:arf-GAP with Rho-GAP domain, ANK repeat and PH domain-containing protein 1 [Alosa pseudoharengus]|uniref:arf-GAP with Rho-GAP domain, ANK repeat and PH domain-containing protein 1 n=1 Tax=Alosa pseudoharengus TaxID=34774 RepID=UPI003F8B2E9E